MEEERLTDNLARQEAELAIDNRALDLVRPLTLMGERDSRPSERGVFSVA